jgi:hypothetical protein
LPKWAGQDIWWYFSYNHSNLNVDNNTWKTSLGAVKINIGLGNAAQVMQINQYQAQLAALNLKANLVSPTTGTGITSNGLTKIIRMLINQFCSTKCIEFKSKFS